MSTSSSRPVGRVAIVTGRRIGGGCALMFARQGARVMVTDIVPAAAARTVSMAASEGLPTDSTHPVDVEP